MTNILCVGAGYVGGPTMERILNSNDKDLHFDVVSNPEFLAEGTAIRDMEEPDRVSQHSGSPKAL